MLKHFYYLFISLCLCLSSSAFAGPSYRGFQITLDLSSDSAQQLSQAWGINIARIQIGNNSEMDGTTGAEYISMMQAVFDKFDLLLPILEANNIKVIFALYSPPGGFETRKTPAHYAMFSNAGLQQEYIQIWQEIINRYGSSPSIFAFDLLNEPALRNSQLCAQCKNWNGLLLDTVAAIRALNPSVPLMIKSVYGSPSKLDSLPAINDSNIIYSYHAYPFLSYQQAGIYKRKRNAKRPSKKQIAAALLGSLGKFYRKQYAYFQSGQIPNYPPRLSAGEFGVSSAAINRPGKFMDDLISVLEGGVSFPAAQARSKKWKFAKEVVHESWISHAFGEAQIWDPRYSCTAPNKCKLKNETDRSLILKKYFNRNLH